MSSSTTITTESFDTRTADGTTDVGPVATRRARVRTVGIAAGVAGSPADSTPDPAPHATHRSNFDRHAGDVVVAFVAFVASG